METVPTILIVEDETDIREILQFNLESEGFKVDLAESAEEALEIFDSSHELILLDVMMEGMSGYKMAEKLRKSKNQVPIIFLTAKNTENDMLTGFSIGGDDYITKPFSIKEVVARIKSVLKRSDKPVLVEKESNMVTIDGLEVNLETKQVTIDKNTVDLTKTEFEILVFLLKNENKIHSRAEILNKVWRNNEFVLERTVDVHIARLRKKIGSYGKLIVNKTGYGYSFSMK
ncbi:response regulator transcription factor [Apibacter raozihei]|uniref:response regulator transcription factor n=1 Tax=Apibacter TaxID=1778601 RepID=UPI000FE37E6C|nr:MULTISPECIES: response regulator transcription factor [Apibacter]